MKSTVVLTLEMDDTAKAAAELTCALHESLTLEKHGVGILYCDSDMDTSALSKALHEQLGIDILGCTALATINGKDGYHEMAATLTVLTCDDCTFTTAVSSPLTAATASQKIADTYAAACAPLPERPKLIFALPPTATDIIFDQYLDALSEASGDVPIIGGLPSGVDDATEKLVFLNGASTSDCIVLLLIAGTLDPLFAMRNVVSRFSERTHVVTKAEGIVIHEVDGAPFLDYIKNFGLDASQLTDTQNRVFFQTNPLLVQDDDSHAPYVRILRDVDAQTGSGTCFARVPQGATLAIGALRREDIKQSVHEGIHNLLEQIQQSDHPENYSTILCVTCSARHMVMTPLVEMESDIIKAALPDHLSFSGFYSFGELCPTAYSDGVAQNRAHNASIVFCAM